MKKQKGKEKNGSKQILVRCIEVKEDSYGA